MRSRDGQSARSREGSHYTASPGDDDEIKDEMKDEDDVEIEVDEDDVEDLEDDNAEDR